MKRKGPRKINIPTLRIPKDATPEEIKKMTKKFLKKLKSGGMPNLHLKENDEEPLS